MITVVVVTLIACAVIATALGLWLSAWEPTIAWGWLTDGDDPDLVADAADIWAEWVFDLTNGGAS